jgi:hypothetical protein
VRRGAADVAGCRPLGRLPGLDATCARSSPPLMATDNGGASTCPAVPDSQRQLRRRDADHPFLVCPPCGTGPRLEDVSGST